MIENLQMYTQENVRKITPWKIVEKALLEIHYLEIAQPGKCQNGKCTPWKMKEKAHTGK